MLKQLHIENYALIRQSDISFGAGFTAITGETGAGKSIMLGALGLLLGQRADTAVLADKSRKCVVEAQFDISGLGLEPLFAEADIDYDPLLILRRELLPSAKSRAFVNDTPAQLPFLKALAPHLVDIHSQHQTLTLSDSQFRLDLLDALCPHSAAEAYREAYGRYTALKRDLEELTAADAQARREADYLQFQYDELEAAHLDPNEQEELEQESQTLAHAESISERLMEASAALNADDGGVLAQLRAVKQSLAHVAPYHPDSDALLQRVGSSLIELDDIGREVEHLGTTIVYSPARQQEVDDRLALLYRLEKKHGVESEADLLRLRDEFDARLRDIGTLDSRISDLMEQVDAAYATVQSLADTLSAERAQAGTALAAALLPTLRELGMQEARFEVQLATLQELTRNGQDRALFLFNANRGGELRDLSRVASGGELSRLMLAIKAALTSRSLLPTIIFDEIDTGVSGDISVAVAHIMQRMARHMQVIAITHLPQIAARAAQHLKVYKQVAEGEESTVSRIRALDTGERLREVAVMLSSEPPTEAALQTAKELMA